MSVSLHLKCAIKVCSSSQDAAIYRKNVPFHDGLFQQPSLLDLLKTDEVHFVVDFPNLESKKMTAILIPKATAQSSVPGVLRIASRVPNTS